MTTKLNMFDDLDLMFFELNKEKSDKKPGESLKHYGVKGMKWGVRRSQEQLDRAAGRKVTTSNSSGDSTKGRANLKSKNKSSGGSSGGSSSSNNSSDNGKANLKSKSLNPAKRAGAKAGATLRSRSNTRRKNREISKKASKSAKDLTTQELRDITNRIELERKFNQLTTPQKVSMKQRVEQLIQYGNMANNAVSTGTNLYKNGKTIMKLLEEQAKKK